MYNSIYKRNKIDYNGISNNKNLPITNKIDLINTMLIVIVIKFRDNQQDDNKNTCKWDMY